MDAFKTYVNQVSDFIGGAVAGLFMTLAVAAFLYTVVRFIMARAKGGDGNAIKDARNQLGWSIVGLFVIFSIWGIIAFLQTALPSGNKTTITPPSVSVTGGSSSSGSGSTSGSSGSGSGSSPTTDDRKPGTSYYSNLESCKFYNDCTPDKCTKSVSGDRYYCKN